MPLTRREFEAAACRIWPRHFHARDRLGQRIDWLFGLAYATPAGTPLSRDADFLVDLLEARAALPDNHRLAAVFPRPAEAH